MFKNYKIQGTDELTISINDEGQVLFIKDSKGRSLHVKNIGEIYFDLDSIRLLDTSLFSGLFEEILFLQPTSIDELKSIIKRCWGVIWPTDGMVIQHEEDALWIGEKYKSHDDREYYGSKSKRSGIFRKRWTINLPVINIFLYGA